MIPVKLKNRMDNILQKPAKLADEKNKKIAKLAQEERERLLTKLE